MQQMQTSNICCLWLVLLLSTTWTTTTTTATTAPPATWNVGLLISMTNALVGTDPVQAQTAFTLALAEINNSTLLGGDMLVGTTFDIRGQALGGLLQSLNGSDFCGVSHNPMDAYIGPLTSNDAQNAAAPLGILGFPVISFAASSAQLSDKTSYPTFRRTAPSATRSGGALAAVAASFGWKRVAIIGTNDAFGTGLTSSFTVLGVSLGIDMLTIQLFTPGLSTLSILPFMQSVQSSGAWIIILCASTADATNIMSIAKNMSMLAAPYQWMSINQNTAILPIGSFYTVTGINLTSDSVMAFKQRFNAFSGTTALFDPNSNGAELCYDAVYLLADSIRLYKRAQTSCPTYPGLPYPPNICSTISKSSRSSVVSTLLLSASVPNGVTGNVTLDANGDRVIGFYVYNKIAPTIAGDTLSFDVDVFSGAKYHTASIPQSLVFVGGGNHVPVDHPQPLMGDVLPAFLTASVLVLSFGISVLGSWTSLILIDQSIHNAKQHHRWAARAWASASASALTVGIWASILVGMSSLSIPLVPNGKVVYLSVNVFTSLLIALATTVSSFLFMLKTMKTTRQESPGSTSQNDNITTTTLSATPNSSKTAKSSTANVSHSLSMEKETPRGLRHSRYFAIGVGLFGSTGLVVGGIVAAHFVIFISLQMDVTFAISPGMIILAVLLCGFFVCIAIWTFFYLRVSNWRWVAAFLMAAGIDSAHFTLLGSTVFSYAPGATSSSVSANGIQSDIMQIIGASVTCVVSFLLIGLNVTKLRLSKDVLDKFLLDAQRKAKALEVQIDYTQRLLWKTEVETQLIHHVRPVISDVAHPFLVNLGSFLRIKLGNRAEKPYIRELAPVTFQVASSVLPGIPEKSPYVYTDVGQVLDIDHKESASAQVSEKGFDKGFDKISDKGSSSDTLTLADLLSSPITLEIFKDSCASSLNKENIAFLLHVKKYEQCETSEERIRVGRNIVDKFFKALLLNVPGPVQSSVMYEASYNNFTPTLFNVVASDIRRLLDNNDFARMKKELRDLCVLVLQITKMLNDYVRQGAPANVLETLAVFNHSNAFENPLLLRL